MKILELYRDYNIPHQTSGHKHCRDGWVNTVCPFCTGNAGLHLGASLNGEVFTCWRCGWKPPDKAIAGLVGISKSKAQSVIKEYGGKSRAVENQVKQAPRLKAHKLPSDVGGMEVRHKKYLASRGFNPNKLERKWKLKATGPISRLDGITTPIEFLPLFTGRGKEYPSKPEILQVCTMPNIWDVQRRGN